MPSIDLPAPTGETAGLARRSARNVDVHGLPAWLRRPGCRPPDTWRPPDHARSAFAHPSCRAVSSIPPGAAVAGRARRPCRRRHRGLLVALFLCGLLTIPAGVDDHPPRQTAPTLRPTGRATAHTTGHVSAYWLVAADGGIFSFGGAGFYGSTGAIHLNRPVVGMAGTRTSQGYWLVAADGGIFSFGDARFYGSMGGRHLNAPVVDLAPTPDGGGYWLVAADGGVFSFGDAGFYGSMGGHPLNQPVVGMAATPDGKGYWLVAADGGIFAFGDAQFHGSTGNITLNQPIVGMTADPNGHGYWFTASDGGVFAFGDAPFDGSLGSVPQSRPIVAITASADGGGYWFTNNNGAVTAYGDATYWGSAPQVLNRPVVGMAEATGNGNFTGSSYPSGSYGYDISNYQCPSQGGTLPASPTPSGWSRWWANPRAAPTAASGPRRRGPPAVSTSTSI